MLSLYPDNILQSKSWRFFCKFSKKHHPPLTFPHWGKNRLLQHTCGLLLFPVLLTYDDSDHKIHPSFEAKFSVQLIHRGICQCYPVHFKNRCVLNFWTRGTKLNVQLSLVAKCFHHSPGHPNAFTNWYWLDHSNCDSTHVVISIHATKHKQILAWNLPSRCEATVHTESELDQLGHWLQVKDWINRNARDFKRFLWFSDISVWATFGKIHCSFSVCSPVEAHFLLAPEHPRASNATILPSSCLHLLTITLK